MIRGEASHHPGPAAVGLPAALAEAIVAQARAEYPNEACGIIAGTADPADGGWKYLSAGTFERDLDEMEDDLEGGVSWW